MDIIAVMDYIIGREIKNLSAKEVVASIIGKIL